MGPHSSQEPCKEQENRAESPVKIPDAMCLQLLACDGMGGPEMAQQAQCAIPRNLPDAEKAQNVIYPICVEIPACTQ